MTLIYLYSKAYSYRNNANIQQNRKLPLWRSYTVKQTVTVITLIYSKTESYRNDAHIQ